MIKNILVLKYFDGMWLSCLVDRYVYVYIYYVYMFCLGYVYEFFSLWYGVIMYEFVKGLVFFDFWLKFFKWNFLVVVFIY